MRMVIANKTGGFKLKWHWCFPYTWGMKEDFCAVVLFLHGLNAWVSRANG
jgi:hypothetical protein